MNDGSSILSKEGAYIDEAAGDDYLAKANDEARQKEWAKIGLPDPCMVRAWWALKRELPVNEMNYRTWLDNGALVFIPTVGNGEWNYNTSMELGRLENRLRDHLAQPVVEPEPPAKQPEPPAETHTDQSPPQEN